jgi:prepilin-type processing-associated H-X9-DG protein
MLEYFWKTPSYRKTFTRHMGGSNLGFADGHAKFFLADAILNQSAPDVYQTGSTTPALQAQADFEGLVNCNPLTPYWQTSCACW